MGFLSDLGNFASNVLSGIGQAISDTATTVANAASSAAHWFTDTLSHTTAIITEFVSPVPLVSGIANAASVVANDAARGAEIVVQHTAMWVSEAGQAVDTIVSTTGEVISDVSNFNLGGAFTDIADGIGEIIGRDIQYLSEHIKHDAELIQIPVHAISESVVELLKPLLGDNVVTNAPKVLDSLQHLIIEDGLENGVLIPLLNGAERINNAVFHPVDNELTHADMGMGWYYDQTGHMETMDAEVQLVGVANPDLHLDAAII